MNGAWFKTAAAVGVLCVMTAGCSQSSAQADGGAQAASQGVAANATGCPQQNVEKACLTLKGAGGVVYDVSSAGIDLSRGKGVALMGRDNGETSACGKVLSDVTYDYLGIQCAAPASTQVAEATPQ